MEKKSEESTEKGSQWISKDGTAIDVDKSKGCSVRTVRKESYWYNEIGTIVTVEKKGGKYPILVRFTKVNYSGTNSGNFSGAELELVSP